MITVAQIVYEVVDEAVGIIDKIVKRRIGEVIVVITVLLWAVVLCYYPLIGRCLYPACELNHFPASYFRIEPWTHVDVV